jgi:hypothetical protein
MTAVTVYGVCAVSFMMAMYALEHRGRRFVLAFVLGCLLSSAYVWSGIALRRYRRLAGL